MQVKTITVNGAGMMTARQGIQGKENPIEQEGNLFGPECKVTISKAGRNLSELQMAQAGTDSLGERDIKAEARALHQQGETSKLKEDLRNIFEECGLEGDRLRERVDSFYQEIIERSKGDLEVPTDTVTVEKMTAATELIEKLKNINYEDIKIDPARAQDLTQVMQEYETPNFRGAETQ